MGAADMASGRQYGLGQDFLDFYRDKLKADEERLKGLEGAGGDGGGGGGGGKNDPFGWLTKLFGGQGNVDTMENLNTLFGAGTGDPIAIGKMIKGSTNRPEDNPGIKFLFGDPDDEESTGISGLFS
jgi:hypothetical protein